VFSVCEQFNTSALKVGRRKKKGKTDQLYHIIWEDGDEEDYDEKQYNAGITFYREKFDRKNDSVSVCINDKEENPDRHSKKLRNPPEPALTSSSPSRLESGESTLLTEMAADGYFQDDFGLASVLGKRKIKTHSIQMKRKSTSPCRAPSPSEMWITDHASVETSVAAFTRNLEKCARSVVSCLLGRWR
jgi:hypothetical protein